MVIYKYPVTPGEFSVAMPVASTVVAVQLQGDEPQMWAVVDPGRPAISRPLVEEWIALQALEPYVREQA